MTRVLKEEGWQLDRLEVNGLRHGVGADTPLLQRGASSIPGRMIVQVVNRIAAGEESGWF